LNKPQSTAECDRRLSPVPASGVAGSRFQLLARESVFEQEMEAISSLADLAEQLCGLEFY
jgi:hypothetical protein